VENFLGMVNKHCKECPWVIRNKNNDSIINHSKRMGKGHNCHMTIKNEKLWDVVPEFQCLGNKLFLKSISTTNVDK
jgi:hypothetical protein